MPEPARDRLVASSDPLAAWAAAEPEALALSATSGTWSVRQLDGAVDALVHHWRAEDIQVGDRVATLLEDDAPAVLAVHAARRAGLVLVLLNRRAALPELAAQLADIDVAVLLHDDAGEARAREIATATGVRLRSVEGLVEARTGWLASTQQPLAPEPGVPATIIFTSGTTGRPRGALLTHANHEASADAWGAVLAPRDSDRWLACLPLHHVAGLAIVIRSARWRVPLEVVPRFDAVEVAQRIEAGVSHLSLVPTQLQDLVRVWGQRPVPASLRAVLLGGAPIPAPVLAAARAMGLPVMTTYGMTETASGIAVGGAEPSTLEDPSALRPLPGVGLRISAPGPDGVGAIEVRGGMVFDGYVGPGGVLDAGGALSTGGALDAAPGERWLRTGDLGSLDAKGLLRVSDRRDDLIISGGENVYPAEVEAVLHEHPFVLEAAVAAAPDARWGSVPVAAVVLVPGARVADAELEQHCRERLASYKVPVRFQRFAALPRGEGGKVLRRTLRDQLAESGQ